MGLSNTIIKGKVSRKEFEKWKNNVPDALVLHVPYGGEIEFLTKEEVLEKAQKEVYDPNMYDSELDMLHDLGYYYNSDDFYDEERIQESFGEYDYSIIDNNYVLVIVTMLV